MKVELSLEELTHLRYAATLVKYGRGMTPTRAAFCIIPKLDSIIVAAQCAEGQKFIKEEK